MREIALPNAAAHKITVTSTAQTLEQLISTSAGSDFSFPVGANVVEICAESGSVRFASDHNTPTATNGILIREGEIRFIRVPLPDIKLIRAEGTNAVCSVRVGSSNSDSEVSFTAGDVNIPGFVTEPYDYQILTYVPSGDGAGEIQTVTYKQGGASGTTIAVLTLTYDASNRISTITKS